jgi:hypothetical protein
VCKPWRELTDNPHGGEVKLDSRFRPSGWVVVAITPDAMPHQRLLNLDGVLPRRRPPDTLHTLVYAADGLLVLFDNATKVIRLLNPLSNTVTEFPFVSDIVSATVPPPRGQITSWSCSRIPVA